jgi:hypothetical protein
MWVRVGRWKTEVRRLKIDFILFRRNLNNFTQFINNEPQTFVAF